MGLRSIRARATALSMGRRRLISLLCGLLVIGLLVTAGYSQRPGRWTRASPMPEERTEGAVTGLAGEGGVGGGVAGGPGELGGKVYVVGGFGGGLSILGDGPVIEIMEQGCAGVEAPNQPTSAAVSGRL